MTSAAGATGDGTDLPGSSSVSHQLPLDASVGVGAVRNAGASAFSLLNGFWEAVLAPQEGTKGTQAN